MRKRNFTCEICRVRRLEDELREQDELRVCASTCYEEGGGRLDRDLERAHAAEIAAVLDAHEQRPVAWPSALDGNSASLSWISDFSVRPLTLTAGGASEGLVLTGGFRAADTVTYDHASITNSATAIAATTITLTVQAGALAPKGLHRLYLNDEPYNDCIDVR